MTSFIVACIAITIVILIAAFIIGAIGGIITGTARSAKKSPLKSIIVLILTGWFISSASKYKKVEQPQQAISPAQTQIQPPQSVICTQTKKINNPPPTTNTLHRRISIHVYGDYNMTEIEDVIYRRMDTRPNAPLIEQNISTSDGSITAEIEWKESMPNPPEIKSTVAEIIDMSQNVDSEQKEHIEKLLARMQKPVYTRIDHDTLNKPHPISVESNQQCVNKSQ